MYNIIICTSVFMCSITTIYLPPVMNSGIHSLNCGLLMSLFFFSQRESCDILTVPDFWEHPVVAVAFVWAAVVSTPPYLYGILLHVRTCVSDGCLISSHPSNYSGLLLAFISGLDVFVAT